MYFRADISSFLQELKFDRHGLLLRFEYSFYRILLSDDGSVHVQRGLVITMSVIAKYCLLRYKVCILTLTKQ